MRGTHYALVDEADCILIDEARTPLIIGIQDLAQAQIANPLLSLGRRTCRSVRSVATLRLRFRPPARAAERRRL